MGRSVVQLRDEADITFLEFNVDPCTYEVLSVWSSWEPVLARPMFGYWFVLFSSGTSRMSQEYEQKGLLLLARVWILPYPLLFF
jgi:hypothetical protein